MSADTLDYQRHVTDKYSPRFWLVGLAAGLFVVDVCWSLYVARHVALHADYGYYEGMNGYGFLATLSARWITRMAIVSWLAALFYSRVPWRWWLGFLFPAYAYFMFVHMEMMGMHDIRYIFNFDGLIALLVA